MGPTWGKTHRKGLSRRRPLHPRLHDRLLLVCGIVACIALLANLLLTVAFLTLVNATFTLRAGGPGTHAWHGGRCQRADYERCARNANARLLGQAIRNGYDRAFRRYIDTHLSSIFTAIVLYTVGNDQLKGFGISLTVGLAISLFTSLVMTRLMFDIWQYKGWLKKLTMMKLFTKPNIDFMAIRYYWFAATIILTIAGASLFFYHLDRGGLNIDFTGGTAYAGQLTEPVSMVQLRGMLEKSDLPDLSIEQTFVNVGDFSQGDKSKLFTVRTSEKDRNKVLQSINNMLGDKLHETDLQSFEIDKSRAKDATLAFDEPPHQEACFRITGPGKHASGNEIQKAGMDRQLSSSPGRSWAKSRKAVSSGCICNSCGRRRQQVDSVLKATQAAFEHAPPERLENFDSQLASETQKRALYAIMASWAAILLYLWFRFGSWTFGLAAVVCLVHDLFFTLGWIAACHYIHESMPSVASALLIQDFKIDLPTVAALLTLVGYSVSDTIVVFDRIREVRGKNPELTPQMINDSVNQTLSRTLLTAFSVWLVVLVLYVWGGEGVHLFAFVMVVGVIVGTYSSIYIASPLLLIFREGTRQVQGSSRQRPDGQGVDVSVCRENKASHRWWLAFRFGMSGDIVPGHLTPAGRQSACRDGCEVAAAR